MRIIAQAVPVSLCQIFLLETVQDCTEEQIMQVPVLQIIEICRNHMPVLYVAFRFRPPSKKSTQVPNMQVVVGALFLNFGLTHWTPAAGYTYWAHAQGLVLAADQFVGDRGLGTKNPFYQALNRAKSPGADGSLATPHLLSGASRT